MWRLSIYNGQMFSNEELKAREKELNPDESEQTYLVYPLCKCNWIGLDATL